MPPPLEVDKNMWRMWRMQSQKWLGWAANYLPKRIVRDCGLGLHDAVASHVLKMSCRIIYSTGVPLIYLGVGGRLHAR